MSFMVTLEAPAQNRSHVRVAMCCSCEMAAKPSLRALVAAPSASVQWPLNVDRI